VYNMPMQPQTFIFFGPSGCGKGTQAKLLQEELEKKDPGRKILYIETGQKFRELAEKDSYTGREVKKILEEGILAPVFLPIWIWTGILMENANGNEHIFMDGMSRKIEEAYILDSAIKFYKRENPTVVSIEVSDKWATERLLGRGRNDDTEEEIKNRLGFYHKDVIPVIEYFKNDPYYKFIPINGEQTIEEVHQELMQKVGL
jgi:adenylate kinase